MGGTLKVLGLVIRTAYMTSKGTLVRDIMYPRPNKFKFYRDTMIFIAFMTLLVFVGFAICIKSLVDFHIPINTIITGFLDMLTISIPAILPSCMTVGTLYAIGRLKE